MDQRHSPGPRRPSVRGVLGSEGASGSLAHLAGNDHRLPLRHVGAGSNGVDREIAYAGSCLDSSELDYTGNITLYGDPDTVYISTKVKLKSGAPPPSRADGKRHYEIFRGTTTDGGASWSWTAITILDSSADNLRPIVPDGSGDNTVLLWLRGAYRAYTDYNLAVVGVISRRQEAATPRGP